MGKEERDELCKKVRLRHNGAAPDSKEPLQTHQCPPESTHHHEPCLPHPQGQSHKFYCATTSSPEYSPTVSRSGSSGRASSDVWGFLHRGSGRSRGGARSLLCPDPGSTQPHAGAPTEPSLGHPRTRKASRNDALGSSRQRLTVPESTDP